VVQEVVALAVLVDSPEPLELQIQAAAEAELEEVLAQVLF
jgi:hypothetical protein